MRGRGRAEGGARVERGVSVRGACGGRPAVRRRVPPVGRQPGAGGAAARGLRRAGRLRPAGGGGRRALAAQLLRLWLRDLPDPLLPPAAARAILALHAGTHRHRHHSHSFRAQATLALQSAITYTAIYLTRCQPLTVSSIWSMDVTVAIYKLPIG